MTCTTRPTSRRPFAEIQTDYELGLGSNDPAARDSDANVDALAAVPGRSPPCTAAVHDRRASSRDCRARSAKHRSGRVDVITTSEAESWVVLQRWA
jgi:hypothetical protein